jgi:tetratricopeptide (TPR) repeat protein
MELLTYFIKASVKNEMQKHEREKEKFLRLSVVKQLAQSAHDDNDERTEAHYLIELGNVYAYYSDYQLSDSIYAQAYAMAGQIPDKELEVVALANLGHSYVKRLDYQKANSYFEKALGISRAMGNLDLIDKIEAHFTEIENMKKFEKFIDMDKE